MRVRPQKYFIITTVLAAGLFFGFRTSADVPLAARLLSIAYNDTSQGGLRVTVTGGFNGLRGISNDGTTMYLLDGSGNITTLPMSSLTGSAGSSISVAGTTHSVGWGTGGAPSFGSPDGRSLAYSHGCLFLSNSGDTTHLDCVDISDWSATQIAVPGDEQLPAGHGWASETLIDFADGRIGKVSAYAATSTPSSGYSSYIRMYTVSGTGKAATVAWSHDYYMFDTENWNTDDHGIATDGTYLYRIEFSGNHLSDGDFKSWPLQDSGSPSQVYVGLYTAPFANMTYLSHDHTGDRYMTANYAGNQFYITSASDPGPGPGNPLTPAFGTVASVTGGFTTQVTNYDSSFTWSATSTAGSIGINGSGLVTVSGLAENQTATATITTQKTNVPNGSASVSGAAADTPPTFSSLAATSTASTTTAVTWNTNKAASTKVVYSADTAYASSTAETDTSPRLTGHSASLGNLLACTIYNYKAASADSAGSYATSTAGTFTTTGCSGGAIPSASTSTNVTVSSAATSTVTDLGRTLSVATPANFTATSSSIVIQIKGLSSDTVLGSIGKPGSLSSAASIVFDVTALINNTTVLDSFNTPVTVSYTFTDADVSGLDKTTLKMYHYHNGSWLALDNCAVDTAANKITCSAPSFSVFAIFGSAVTTTTASNSNSGGGLPPVAYLKPAVPAGGFTLTLQKISGTSYNIISNAASDVKYIALSTNPEFSNAGLIPYGQSLTWNACQPGVACPAGQVTVYAKFYTSWGQQSDVLTAKAEFSQPSVKAAAKTQATQVCPYFTKYEQRGDAGPEVKKIRQFLNNFENAGLSLSQAYDAALVLAVKNFQASYAPQILAPWGFTKPTGRWYQSTMKTANDLLGCHTSVKLDNGKFLP